MTTFDRDSDEVFGEYVGDDDWTTPLTAANIKLTVEGHT